MYYTYDTIFNCPNRKLLKQRAYFDLDTDGIDVNVQDYIGETQLITACRFNNSENINLLSQNKNLDYLHCNNNSDDVAKIINIISKHKEKYQYIMMLVNSLQNLTQQIEHAVLEDYQDQMELIH